MKAVQVRAPGPPEALECVEVERPRPAAGELLVRAHAIGVGIPDVMIRQGIYPWMPPLPAIPGMEMSGVVVEAGDTGISVGLPVIVSARERPHRGGCYAEYMTAKPSETFTLPRSVDLDAAAALGNYQVAWHLIHSASRTRVGETVLVFGAAGGVGSAAVQLAVQAGLRVVGVASSEEKCAFVLECGASGAIDRSREDVALRLAELTSGRGADLVLDPVGGPGFPGNVALLAPLGLLVSYGGLGGTPTGDLLGAMNRRFGTSPAVRRFSMHSFDADPPRRAEATRALIDLLAVGRIRPRIACKLPLADASRAHRMLESGRAIGKILLVP